MAKLNGHSYPPCTYNFQHRTMSYHFEPTCMGCCFDCQSHSPPSFRPKDCCSCPQEYYCRFCFSPPNHLHSRSHPWPNSPFTHQTQSPAALKPSTQNPHTTEAAYHPTNHHWPAPASFPPPVQPELVSEPTSVLRETRTNEGRQNTAVTQSTEFTTTNASNTSAITELRQFLHLTAGLYSAQSLHDILAANSDVFGDMSEAEAVRMVARLDKSSA